ncbi:hypothetical protein L1049_004326 [Liquidambar formosana]|uniref:F-box domain-containing protein n=1 Tax=Liquidambar formosana TaxID=63359 RepID=A0AAP0WVK4_LIQFO
MARVSSKHGRDQALKFKVDANNNDMLVALVPKVMELIIQKLDIVDYHRLSVVCKSWRSVAIAAKHSAPMLLIVATTVACALLQQR